MKRKLSYFYPLFLSLLIFSSCVVSGNHKRPLPEGVPKINPHNVPSILYRADKRDPSEIFANGFRSWEDVLGSEGDHNLEHHIDGSSLAAGRSGEGSPTPFISTTEDHYVGMMFLTQMGLAMTSGLIPQTPHIWLYEIEPQYPANVISVVWAFRDYVVRNSPVRSQPPNTERARRIDRLDDAFYKQREWTFEGNIPASMIMRARRFSLNESGLFSFDGHEEINPNYVQGNMAAIQTGNILDSFDPIPTPPPSPIPSDDEDYDFYALSLNDTEEEGATGGTLPFLMPLSLGNCFSEPDSSPQKRSAGNSSCLLKPSALFKGQRSNNKDDALFKILGFGRDKCLMPYAMDGYLGVSYTDCKNATKWRYDNLSRFSILWGHNYWCLTAPSKAIEYGGWDYMRMLPCDVSENYQTFILKNGTIYNKYGRLNLPIQIWDSHLMLSSKKDGHNLVIKNEDLGAVKAQSKPYTYQTELKMFWKNHGTRYYSNYNNVTPWSKDYWNRSYYDPESKLISYVNLATAGAIAAGSAQKYCLRTRLFNHQWNWTDWVKCNDKYDSLDLKWDFLDRGNSENNLGGGVVFIGLKYQDELWVDVTGSNAGFYFTSKLGRHSGATNHFGIKSDLALNIPYRTKRALNRWSDARKGKVGNYYIHYNNNQRASIFKLKSNPYGYFPPYGTSTDSWEFKGSQLWKYGEKGKVGDVYEYDNPYDGYKKIYFRLKNEDYGNFPTGGYDNKSWYYMGVH